MSRLIVGTFRCYMGKLNVCPGLGINTLADALTLCSYSTGTAQVDAEFGVGVEVGTLGTALLLFGLGIALCIRWIDCIQSLTCYRAGSIGLRATVRGLRPQTSSPRTLLHCSSLLVWNSHCQRRADGDDHPLLHWVLWLGSGNQHWRCPG